MVRLSLLAPWSPPPQFSHPSALPEETLRKIPELDRIYVHKVEDRLKKLCRNHWERTGKKALIILFDDTMSRYANSAKSVINQIGKYANVIVIVTMFEF